MNHNNKSIHRGKWKYDMKHSHPRIGNKGRGNTLTEKKKKKWRVECAKRHNRLQTLNNQRPQHYNYITKSRFLRTKTHPHIYWGPKQEVKPQETTNGCPPDDRVRRPPETAAAGASSEKQQSAVHLVSPGPSRGAPSLHTKGPREERKKDLAQK